MTNKAGEQPTITQADYTVADYELAEQCVSAANVVTCDGYYEVDIEKVAETLAKARTTSLAAQDGLVEALERCAQIVEQWNHRQNEKVDDIKYIVRNALSAIKGDKS